MSFFTLLCHSRSCLYLLIALGVLFSTSLLPAQTDTNPGIPGPGQISLDASNAATNGSATNAPPASVPDATSSAVSTPTGTLTPALTEAISVDAKIVSVSSRSILGALFAFASLGGFLLYQCGLVRAKNSGHTSTLLLVGTLFGLGGYWVGGFAAQTGGIGDTHAALSQAYLPVEKSALDHELGFPAFGHHWGFMGSSGFFLATDDPARNDVALLFLIQAALLAISIAAALGASLERGKLLAMAFCSYLVGLFIYPLVANWVWGGGWLAQLGNGLGLGHGFIDLGGDGVVHETAGTLALVLAVVLGPRHGRFGRNQVSLPIPGHHVPYIVLGSVILLISWMATNAYADSGLISSTAGQGIGTSAGLAAINTLLAAIGGMMISFIQAAWKKRRPEPAWLCRGLLGGAVASSACAGLIDPWAAFIIGGIAGFLVNAVMNYLERARIDDPVGAAAVHGAGGAWGVLAAGLFANGSAGEGLNGVAGPVRGLFFGGAWHQLIAQVIGCVVDFGFVYVLGYAFVSLVHKVLGNRVSLADEASGLDWPETGALGYQTDTEPEENNGKRD